jgi:hypothetical protein
VHLQKVIDMASDEAIVAIGIDAPADLALMPKEHAASLPSQAGALRRVLERPTLKETIDAFEVADREAKRSQKQYKLLAGGSAMFSFVAIVLAAGVLLLSARIIDTQINLRWVAGLQGLFLVLSFTLSLIVTGWRPFEKWMEARATAEWNRILFFKRVTDANEVAASGELHLLPLQLEYFRRYQLDVQMKYYKDRGAEHAKAVRRSIILRWVSTCILILAGAPIVASLMGVDVAQWLGGVGFGVWAQDLDVQERLFVSLSTVGAALQGWLAALGLMNQDQRNASRYGATARNLETLSGRSLADARVAAAKGELKNVRAFIDLIQEQVSSEHREWVDLRTLTANSSLESMKDVGLIRL